MSEKTPTPVRGTDRGLTLVEVVLAAGKSYKFEVDPFRRDCLLNGWDDIGLTLKHAADIDTFEARHKTNHPYYANV